MPVKSRHMPGSPPATTSHHAMPPSRMTPFALSPWRAFLCAGFGYTWGMSDNPVGRPLAFQSVEELESAIDSYFEKDAFVGEGDSRLYAPTMSGLALALGVDRKTITNYGKKDEYFHTVKKARARVEVALEQRLYGNNVTGIIFNLKNNFEWQDKQDLAHTSPDGSMKPTHITLSAPDDHGDS